MQHKGWRCQRSTDFMSAKISTNAFQQCYSSPMQQIIFNLHKYFPVAYGAHCYWVCAVCNVTIWRDIQVSSPKFWRRFLTQYAYYSTHTLLIRCYMILFVIVLTINYQRSKLRCWSKIRSTLRQNSSWLQKYRLRECFLHRRIEHAKKMCGSHGARRTPRVAKSKHVKLRKMRMRIKYAIKLSFFYVAAKCTATGGKDTSLF